MINVATETSLCLFSVLNHKNKHQRPATKTEHIQTKKNCTHIFIVKKGPILFKSHFVDIFQQ